MRKAVRLNPNDVEAQFFLGNLYLPEKNRQAALAQYAGIKSLNPQIAEKLYRVIYGGKIVTVSAK